MGHHGPTPPPLHADRISQESSILDELFHNETMRGLYMIYIIRHARAIEVAQSQQSETGCLATVLSLCEPCA
jgi:hypothetical protein